MKQRLTGNNIITVSWKFFAIGHTNSTSLAPPLRRMGEGERAEESGDTAIQNLALSTDLGAPIRLLQARGSY